MNHDPGSLVRTFLVLAVLVQQLAPVRAAEEDRTALLEFQRLAKEADFRQIEAAFKAAHPAPPTKQEVDALVGTLVRSALNVMDETKRFQKRFPESRLLAQVEREAIEVLGMTFGSKAFPIPKDRAADVQEFVRERLVHAPENPQLHMLRYRLLPNVPADRRRAELEELSKEPTPEPARSMAKEHLQRIKWLGKPLELTFTALDGSKVSVAALKGKVVLISFWSTTCQPCMRDIPELKKLWNGHRGKGFAIIGISLDTDRGELERVVKKEQIPWPQYFNPAGPESPTVQSCGIRSLPVEWLVGRDGVVRDVNARESLAGKIEVLLRE